MSPCGHVLLPTLKNQKNQKIKNYKNICFCLCVFVCFIVLYSFQSRWWIEFNCYDLENVGYMLRLCVVCFEFNLHNLWVLEFPCSHHLCRLIDCNPRSTFRHTLSCIPRKCEDLSLLYIHMYAFFIHLLVLHVCTIHELLNLKLAQRPLETFC